MSPASHRRGSCGREEPCLALSLALRYDLGMQIRASLWIATTLLVSLSACDPSKLHPTAPFSGDASGPPAAAPILTARSAAGEVRLTWTPVPGATGYVVMRGSAAQAPRNLDSKRMRMFSFTGTQLADTQETSLRDAHVSQGYAYSYAVYATNAFGKGPLSAPVTVSLAAGQPKVPLSYAGWQTFVPQPGNYAVQITSVGDFGISNATTFSTGPITMCAAEGITIASIRPALGTQFSDGATWQTFSVTILYNSTTYTWLSASAQATPRDGWSFNLMNEYDYFPPGCSARTYSFSVNLADLDADADVQFRVSGYNPLAFISQWNYRWSSGRWLQLSAVSPEESGLLDGAPLRVHVDYHNLEAGGVYFILSDFFEFGRAETDVAGSGSFDMTIPYELSCQGRFTDLDVSYMLDGRWHRAYLSYNLASSHALEIRTYRRERWVSLQGWGMWSSLGIEDCDQTHGLTLTVSTSRGIIQQEDENYQTIAEGPSLSGTFGDRFMVGLTSDDFTSDGPGVVPVVLTLSAGGDSTSTTINLHLMDGAWVGSPPPAQPDARVPQAVAVTLTKVAPGARVSYGLWEWGQVPDPHFPLAWSGSAYSGWVTYPTCGDSSGFISVSAWGDDVELLHHRVSPANAAMFKLTSPWETVDLTNYQPHGTEINETCERAVSWQVIDAPAWIKFQSLAGFTPGTVTMVLDGTIALANGPSDWGQVIVAPLPDGVPTEIWVEYGN